MTACVDARLRSPWFLAALVLSLFAVWFPTFDWDTPWHLANGREMVASGRLLNEDVFSHTQFGKHYSNREWLAQLILYAPWAAWGTAGLFGFKLLLTAAIAALSWKSLAALRTPAHLAGLLLPLGVLAGFHRYLERPELFSLLGAAGLVALIICSREGLWHRRWLFAIPIVVGVWDCLHGAIFGLAILAGAVVGENLAARFRPAGAPPAAWLRDLNRAAAATLLISLLNPYGILDYGGFSSAFTGADGVGKIAEYQPANLRMHWLAAVMALVGVLALAAKRTPIRLSELFWFLGFALLTWRFSRVAGVFGIVALPWLAGVVASLSAGRRKIASIILLVPLLAGLHFEKFSASSYLDRRAEWFVDERLAPAGAVRFALDQDLQGALYNTGNFGGYLALNLYPRYRIFQFNHGAIWGDTYLADPGIPDRHGIEWAIVGYEEERAAMFPESRWAYVVLDETAILAIRRNSRNDRLVAEFETRHFAPNASAARLAGGLRDPRIGERLAFETAVYCAYRKNDRLCPTLLAHLVGTRPAPPWFEDWREKILRRQREALR